MQSCAEEDVVIVSDHQGLISSSNFERQSDRSELGDPLAMSRFHIAIPVLDELNWLPAQSDQDFFVWVCVNQPDSWWQEPTRLPICELNEACLKLLENENRFTVRILDSSSRGRGWCEKRQGVG